MLIPIAKSSQTISSVKNVLRSLPFSGSTPTTTTTSHRIGFAAMTVAHSSPSLTRLSSTAMAQPLLDLTRVNMRLDGLQSYGVIAALLMNASLRLYASTPKRPENDKPFENFVKFLFSVSMLFSVLSGSFTTIVFSLLGLYSKHALGIGMDNKYLEFFDATKDVRVLGFDSFVVSLASFKLSFCLSLFLNCRGRLRWVILALASFLSIMAWCKWSTIMDLAGAILFSGNVA